MWNIEYKFYIIVYKIMAIHVNVEGQIALAFALGILLGAYTYKILWLAIFLIIWELGYWLIMGYWWPRLRLGLLAAYILGVFTSVYALERFVPFW